MTAASLLLVLVLSAPRVVSLEEALAASAEHQPQLRQAQATLEASKARVDAARSGLLPQVSANASYGLGTANSSARPPNSFDVHNSFNVGLSVNQLIYDFGRTWGQWDAAKATSAAQGFNEKTTQAQVRLSVRAAFFSARANKALLTVARETLDNQERHLKQIQGYVEVGTRPGIDLAQALTDRANARVQVVTSENGYETAKALLNQAMGVEGTTDYDVADSPLAPVDQEEAATDALMTEALAARPEFGALENQVRAQEATQGAIRGAYFPILGVSAAASEGGTDGLAPNWNAGLTLSWPLYQGGLTGAQEREAAANLAGLKSQVDLARQQVRLDIEQARLAVRAAKASMEANVEAVVNAKERLRLAEGRYQTGIGNSLELSDAQLQLTNVEAQTVQADFNLSLARAQLLKALGRP
jgi:outer membrane protein